MGASQSSPLVQAARKLSAAVEAMSFAAPVAHVYNPLDYAWPIFAEYVERFGAAPKRVLLLGMNPGPFGMAQTGVPFGEIAAVRDWMGLRGDPKLPGGVRQPNVATHPKRPIQGLDCPKNEVSGRRLWGLFAERFPNPDDFFAQHFVLNYCPLVFMSDSGANITPDKLPPAKKKALFAACDDHLRQVVEHLQPDWLVGVGKFAEARAEEACADVIAAGDLRIASLLHPSPASPAANRDWAGTAVKQLTKQGIWNG